MNMQQDKDLAIKFDKVCRQLRESGYDLSKIKLSTMTTRNTYYITKRIIEDGRILSNEN